MRTFKKFVPLLVALLSITTQVHAADVPATFNFTGAGYGHGVGMSQIGAKARATSGESATAILKYYYKNVEVLPVVDTATIRVNIGHALKSATFEALGVDATLIAYAGETQVGLMAAKKKITLTLAPDLKSIQGFNSSLVTVNWSGGVNPVVSFAGDRYRYGFIQVRVVKGALEVTNTLSLHDEYLLGISEIPSNWPAAALEAQTIASRSYALSRMGSVKASCDCHLYAHIADQNFVGYSKESEKKIGQLWRAAVLRTVVDSSTGLAILSGGKPIQAYFFSSSGGATQTTSDAWGGPTSYTQSVSDTASVDLRLNPRFANWKASTTQALVASAFSLPNVVSLEIVSRNSAGAVTWIKGTSSEGLSKILRGDTFRSRVKLPSPWFTPAN
ncbi:MAG: SpoIID/LytB domain-containing protein [Candidatus Planktophila sp.]